MPFLPLNDTNVPPSPPEIVISRTVRVCLYAFILPCSLLCTLFLMYRLLTIKIHRQALHHHPLIFLLFIGLIFELFDLPFQMDYLNIGYIRIQSSIFCLICICVEFWCHSANSLLLTWISFHRHILIFHYPWMLKYKYNKILFHYLPLILLFIYLFIYYLVTIIFPSCSTIIDYNAQLCGFFPCILVNTPFIALWDAIVHNTIPILLICLFNVTLITRVVWHKYKLRQPIRWRRYRKLTIQLLIISSWYLLIHLPMMLGVCLLLTGSNNPIIIAMGPYFAYLSYHCILFMPFVCLISLWKDIRPFQQRRAIGPMHNNGINPNLI